MAKDLLEKVLQQAQTPVWLAGKKEGFDFPVFIDGITEPTSFEGGEITVGISAVEVMFTGQTKVIYLQADHDNTGSVWLGKSNVTNAANRMARLNAGESLMITLNDLSESLYLVASDAGQTVYRMALV